jgi:hypothetical protein
MRNLFQILLQFQLAPLHLGVLKFTDQDNCLLISEQQYVLRAELAAHQAGGRGLHSSSFRLKVSAFCVTGNTFMGCLWGVYECYEVLGGMRGCIGGVLCQKWLRLS